jgi:hypothetical protein
MSNVIRLLSLMILASAVACAGLQPRPPVEPFSDLLPECAQKGWTGRGDQNFDGDGRPDPLANLYCGDDVLPVGVHSLKERDGGKKICWEVGEGEVLCGKRKQVLDKGDDEHGPVLFVEIDERPASGRYDKCLFMLRHNVTGAVWSQDPSKVRDRYSATYTCFDHEPTLQDAAAQRSSN